MKLRIGLAFVFTALLSACGGGGVSSPDYGGELIAFEINPPSADVAIGGTQQFTATGRFLAAPSQGGFIDRDVTSGVDWSYADAAPNDAATIDGAGLLTGVRRGAGIVTGSFRGASDTSTVTVDGAVLVSIVVTPESATVPVGGTQQFCAMGVYSDSPTPREILGTVNWVSDSTSIASVTPATGACTTATGLAERAQPVAITASAENQEGDEVSDSSTLTVTNSVVQSLLRLVPATATVQINGTQQYTVCGVFSDGVNAPTGPCSTPPTGQAAGREVSANFLDWTTGSTTIATVEQTGVATGRAVGNSAVTATLKTGIGQPAPAQRSASSQIVVISGDSVCLSPLLASGGATVDTATGALCLGTLLCNVSNPAFVIDDQVSSFATMNLNVGLLGIVPGLGGAASVIATAPTTVTPDGIAPAGFVVGRPAANLLALELLLSQIEVATLDSNGNEVESTTDTSILKLDLLGLLADENQLLASFVPTQPYQSLRLSFGAGVASALSRLDVFSACTVAQLPPTP